MGYIKRFNNKSLNNIVLNLIFLFILHMQFLLIFLMPCIWTQNYHSNRKFAIPPGKTHKFWIFRKSSHSTDKSHNLENAMGIIARAIIIGDNSPQNFMSYS